MAIRQDFNKTIRRIARFFYWFPKSLGSPRGDILNFSGKLLVSFFFFFFFLQQIAYSFDHNGAKISLFFSFVKLPISDNVLVSGYSKQSYCLNMTKGIYSFIWAQTSLCNIRNSIWNFWNFKSDLPLGLEGYEKRKMHSIYCSLHRNVCVVVWILL